jgi:hypothetical protein
MPIYSPDIPDGRFNILTDFLGYGDPMTSKLWFIGIEEFGDLSDPQLHQELARNNDGQNLLNEYFLSRRHSEYHLYEDWQNINVGLYYSQRNTVGIQTRFSTQIRNSIEGADYQHNLEYFTNEFCRSFEFQMNVFPIPFSSTSIWHDGYDGNNNNNVNIFNLGEMFDLGNHQGQDRHNAYFSGYRYKYFSRRFSLFHKYLRARIMNNTVPYIIVMGQSIWDDVSTYLFSQYNINIEYLNPTNRVKHSTNDPFMDKIWFTYHPAGVWRIRENEIVDILEQINIGL